MAFSCQIRPNLAHRISAITIVFFISQHGSSTAGSTKLLRSFSGRFKSEGYPDLDDNNDRTWKIVLPQHHRITVNFLDFDLLQKWFCTDKLEIYDGGHKRGTYKGKQLRRKSMISSSHMLTVVLDACSRSFFWDRKGIDVEYSTVYPTTPTPTPTTKPKTSNKLTSTPQQTVTPSVTTVNGSLSPQQTTPLSSVNTVTTTSTAFITEQQTELHFMKITSQFSQIGSTKESVRLFGGLLAGLCSIIIFVTTVILVVKRRKRSNASLRGNDPNQVQRVLAGIVTERPVIAICQEEYDYVQGCTLENTRKSLSNKNCDDGDTDVSCSTLQRKRRGAIPSDNKSSCGEITYVNADFEEDYSTESFSIRSSPLNVGKNSRRMKSEEINIHEGTVLNAVYEPYFAET